MYLGPYLHIPYIDKPFRNTNHTLLYSIASKALLNWQKYSNVQKLRNDEQHDMAHVSAV